MLGAVAIGLLLFAVAAIYFTTPANHLPAWMPGFDASMTKTHFKHGIGAVVLGLAAFAFAWFQSGPSYPLAEKSENADENQ